MLKISKHHLKRKSVDRLERSLDSHKLKALNRILLNHSCPQAVSKAHKYSTMATSGTQCSHKLNKWEFTRIKIRKLQEKYILKTCNWTSKTQHHIASQFIKIFKRLQIAWLNQLKQVPQF